jgi:GMP synthase (glutamine-hydrolysing)
MRPLLCVRHEPEDDGGLALKTFASSGLQVEMADAWNGTALPDVDAIAGLVVFGGTMNVDQVERYPFLRAERDLVARALDAHLPVLGVCLGAQMLARALGEPVQPAPVRTLGFTPVHPTEAGLDDPLASVFEDGAMTFHWHEDAFGLPPGCEQLASGEDGSVQIFRRDDRTWGIVFHPEVTRDEVRRWLEVSDRATLADQWGADPEQLQRDVERHLPAHEARGRELFRRFAEIVRATALG